MAAVPAEPVLWTTAKLDTIALTGEVVAVEPTGAPELLALEVEPVAESVASLEGTVDGQVHASVDGLALPEIAEAQPTSVLVLNATPVSEALGVEAPPDVIHVRGRNCDWAHRPVIQLQASEEESIEDILALAVLNQLL